MDKRKQKTREAIRNAYAALLLDKQAPKLTITALARKANIDRKTFYLHYDTVEDVMLDYNRQIIERILESQKNSAALAIYASTTPIR